MHPIDPKKIDEILERGVVEVIDKENLRKKLLSGKKLRIKLGIDPTSPHIHLGRAAMLWKLRAFQDLGHKVIFIVGDFTGLIGDTSDKDVERPMLSDIEIKNNITTYFTQAGKIINSWKAEMHYNSTWLKKLGFLEISKMANLFGLHEFESRENISKRLKAGKRVSLRELLYPIMQGYDSVAVKADVEIGGTDQRFNLLAGRQIQPSYNQVSQDIIMGSLIEGTDGRKMSSSWANTINILDTPGEMFGKTMSVPDSLIEKYFILATNVSMSEIEEIKKIQNPRDQKALLAKKIVTMYHSEKEADMAEKEFDNIFKEKEFPSDVKKMKISQMPILELLVKGDLASSKSEAKRLILQGAVKINGEVEKDWQKIIKPENGMKIQVGPRKFLELI